MATCLSSFLLERPQKKTRRVQGRFKSMTIKSDDERLSEGITRRSVLKGSAATGVAALVSSQPSVAETEARTFDYVVVGSGPGGGPLACNLARAGYTVCLIEAGGAA